MAITLTEFGKTLRKARIDHDISLKDLADLLNLSPAFLSGVETVSHFIEYVVADVVFGIGPHHGN